MNSSLRGCSVLYKCWEIPDVLRYKIIICRSWQKFHFFAPKPGRHFWQQFARLVHDGGAFCFPWFLSRGQLSLSCPNGNFSMDRISDASLHAPPHHPTWPPYIKVRHIFLYLTFFWRIYFGKGPKVKKSANTDGHYNSFVRMTTTKRKDFTIKTLSIVACRFFNIY